MSATQVNLGGVFEALNALPPKTFGGGRALMFIAAKRGEGVTTFARSAAEAPHTRPVFAIDLDLRRNDLGRSIAATRKLGARVDGSLGGASFCSAADGAGKPLDGFESAFSYHRAGEARLYVGAFDGRKLTRDARLMISAAPDYWDAVRAGGALAIVDAPALQWSKVGLRVARHMDGVVLVVSSEAGAAPAALAAKAELVAAGANLIGLIYTSAQSPAPVIDRLLRQAS